MDSHPDQSLYPLFLAFLFILYFLIFGTPRLTLFIIEFTMNSYIITVCICFIAKALTLSASIAPPITEGTLALIKNRDSPQ